MVSHGRFVSCVEFSLVACRLCSVLGTVAVHGTPRKDPEMLQV
jgi:hypothetical protein